MRHCSLALVGTASVEALSVDEAREHCEIIGTEQDDLLRRYVKAATRLVQTWLRRQLMKTTYDVFYERRVFARGIPGVTSRIEDVPFGDFVFRLPFAILAVEVCEDTWVPDGPMLRRSASGAELVVNVSASPSGAASSRHGASSSRPAPPTIK